jgi:hypothetical protein
LTTDTKGLLHEVVMPTTSVSSGLALDDVVDVKMLTLSTGGGSSGNRASASRSPSA